MTDRTRHRAIHLRHAPQGIRVLNPVTIGMTPPYLTLRQQQSQPLRDLDLRWETAHRLHPRVKWTVTARQSLHGQGPHDNRGGEQLFRLKESFQCKCETFYFALYSEIPVCPEDIK